MPKKCHVLFEWTLKYQEIVGFITVLLFLGRCREAPDWVVRMDEAGGRHVHVAEGHRRAGHVGHDYEEGLGKQRHAGAGQGLHVGSRPEQVVAHASLFFGGSGIRFRRRVPEIGSAHQRRGGQTIMTSSIFEISNCFVI